MHFTTPTQYTAPCVTHWRIHLTHPGAQNKISLLLWGLDPVARMSWSSPGLASNKSTNPGRICFFEEPKPRRQYQGAHTPGTLKFITSGGAVEGNVG